MLELQMGPFKKTEQMVRGCRVNLNKTDIIPDKCSPGIFVEPLVGKVTPIFTAAGFPLILWIIM